MVNDFDLPEPDGVVTHPPGADGTTGRYIVVIGASAGGVEALKALVCALPADLPAAVFVVLHVWPSAKSFLAAILERVSRLPVSSAVDGQKIELGHIYIAPPDCTFLCVPAR